MKPIAILPASMCVMIQRILRFFVWAPLLASNVFGATLDEAGQSIFSNLPTALSQACDIVDVTREPYLAKGDGIADDTAAIQSAISANASFGNRARIVYLPAGTFQIRKTLEWLTPDGKNASKVFLVGAGKDRTTVRLADSTPGFNDPKNPRAAIFYRSEHNPAWYAHSPQGEKLGEGHLAFYNGLSDLTVEIGQGNPGAIGVSFHVSNMGGIYRTRIRSTDGKGVCALDLTRRNVGPGLLQDLAVEGFDTGLQFGGLYIITCERLSFSGQRGIAIQNRGGVMALREVMTEGQVLSLDNEKPEGLVVLTDCVFNATSPGGAAIVNHGAMLASRVKSGGLPVRIQNHGAMADTAADSDWWTSEPARHFGNAFSASNPIVPPVPKAAELAPADWANVADYGADPTDLVDDTDAIQRALDSGHRGVFFPNWSKGEGRYLVSRTLNIPQSVERVDGGLANLFTAESGQFASLAPDGSAPMLLVTGNGSRPLVIERIFLRNNQRLATAVQSLVHASSRPLVLRHFRFNTIANGPGAGDLFLVDVSAHNPIAGAIRLTYPQHVWAWQLDLEDSLRPKITVGAGVRLWVLGLKSERPSTIVEAYGDAEVTILGALNYQHHPDPKPAYVAHDKSRIAVAFATASSQIRDGTRGFPILGNDVSAQGRRLELTAADLPARGADKALVITPLLTIGGNPD